MLLHGHRPDEIGGYEWCPQHTNIRMAIWKLLVDLKPEKCISGMALGVDQIAAEVCRDLKIPFIAAIPFEGQDKIWPAMSKDKYHSLLADASEIVHVCEPGYAAWKMQKRNEWMVDRCDEVIAVWNGKEEGGTYNCVKYAKKKEKTIHRIDPDGLK